MFEHFTTPWLMITGGDVVLPGGDVMEGGTILINQGLVQDIVEQPPASLLLEHGDVSVVEAHGHWVTPGLIDQHMHGGFGTDFNHAGMREIHELLTRLPYEGVTGVVPTVMTGPKLDMISSLTTLEEVVHTLERHETRILGLHLEGPFLNPDYRGAHPPKELLKPTVANLEGLLSPTLKRLTLAPELDEQFQTIRHLREHDVLVSIGHSDADFVTTVEAIRCGASCAVHLFNAMGPIQHRQPGIAMASLIHDDLFVEFIADGHHLSPVTIQLILKVKPFLKAILISDCNALTGLGSGQSFEFGGQRVTNQKEGPLNEEGRLAGSNTLITDALRNIVHWGILPFPQAVQLATSHPATYLGAGSMVGHIAPKAMADLVLWDKETLEIASVFLGGEPLAQPSESPSTPLSS